MVTRGALAVRTVSLPAGLRCQPQSHTLPVSWSFPLDARLSSLTPGQPSGAGDTANKHIPEAGHRLGRQVGGKTRT